MGNDDAKADEANAIEKEEKIIEFITLYSQLCKQLMKKVK